MRHLLLLLAIACSLFAQATRTVCSTGCDYTPDQLQTALDAMPGAGCGSTLKLAAGVYTGNLTVPASACTLAHPITVKSSGAIPPTGVRATPNYADSGMFPHLVGAGAGAVLRGARGPSPSRGWVFSGLYLDCSSTQGFPACVEFDTDTIVAGSTAANDLPSDIEFNHVIIRGSRTGRTRVGMVIDGQKYRVVDSWIGDIWDVIATDGQAIRTLSGDGPIDIIDTYLEGQTETLGIGGTGSLFTTPPQGPNPWPDPQSPFPGFLTAGSIPANIVVDESHLSHGLWLRYDGMNPYKWTINQSTRMGQVWILCNDASSGGFGCADASHRVGVYQAQNTGASGATIPTGCLTNGCTFTDGTITWKAISNFAVGENYIGAGIAKNLAECKQCGAWTIKRSFLQHTWEGGGGGGAQGFAITSSHRTNVAPYSVMGPLTFKNNMIDDVAGVLQASALADDADSNIYPTVYSSHVSPYTITSGVNDTLVVDGTTVTLPAGTWTAAEIADNINAALPHLTVQSVSAPVDNGPYWTKYTLTLSGNVRYGMAYDVPFILSSIRNGITRVDLGKSGDNLAMTIECTYDSIYNGGAGRDVCGVAANQVRIMLPYGARLTVNPAATMATPTVASSYHDPSSGNDYLIIVKGQYTSTLPISGNAAAALGLPTGTTVWCTHPVTRQWYGCGVSKGLTFVNNLVTNASTDANKFAAARSPYLIWPSNIHPLEISHNTFDYQYGPAFLGQGTPNSGAIRNNIALYRSAAGTGEISYFGDGRQYGLSWIHSYLCAPPLNETNVTTYSWMAAGSTLPDCQPGVASGNVLPGATLYSAEVLPPGNVVPSSTAAPKSTINASLANVVFTPGSYKLATAGMPYLPPGSYNLFGSETASGNSGGALELGTAFKTDIDGRITKLRYFHPANCSAETRTGSLWTATGVQLATGSFPPGVPGTWMEMTLSPPVNIAAGITYVASYHTGSCYAVNMEDLSQPYGSFPLHVVTPASFYSGSGFPSIGDRMGHAADVVFEATGRIATGTNGTVGSTQAKAEDHTDAGVDMSKLPMIRNLQVTYSDRAAIVSWLDSETSQSIPGVLRLCQNDPDYDPTCTPVGSITAIDPESKTLSDNSDNDNSPKNGLQRNIVVTGLAANTKYYAQLYRGGHYRAFSFTTLAALSGSATVSISRAARTSMGPVTTMLTGYGAAYSRHSGSITGNTASIACSAGSNCSNTVTASSGVPLYLQSQMRNSAGSVLYSYPVSVTIPGGATALP